VGDEFRTDHDFFLRFTVPGVEQWRAWLKLTTWLPKRT
jgi:hypothetical protein